MIKKSKKYKWNGQDIFLNINWTIHTKTEDWLKDIKINFNNFSEVRQWFSLPELYKDVYPNYIKVINWEIKLRKNLIEETFEWIILLFSISNNETFTPKKIEEMWKVSIATLNELKETIKKELAKELTEKITKELMYEFSLKTKLDNKTNKIMQKNLKWEIVWLYKNIVHAHSITWVNKSSISQNISWINSTAWWFIWEFII